ncbi:TauD/TfdA family dioxygenase [Streptomyces sp. NPDC047046]|uniref:TauD/TfdA family dioxygenase n=1 Tax=Streptomyces sp. NPDC047046 TaxID=3155378 RepID=UPI0033C27D6E
MRHDIRTTGGTRLAILHTEAPADTWSEARWDEVRGHVRELLGSYGVVMLRGAGVRDTAAFHASVSGFGRDLIQSYRGGNTPRTTLSEGVFTSTEYPARYDITLHNELSYAAKWPERLYFCCLDAPDTGGATPVCDGEALLGALSPEVRDRFASGVVYHQYLHGGAGLGKSWQDTFETTDKEAVGEFLTASAAEFEWTGDGGLRVRQHRPGTVKNPRTGRDTWFNQADQWHPSNLPDDEGELLLSITESVADLPHWVTYADGTPLSDADLAEVRAAQDAHKLIEPWQRGDVMIVDNHSVLHGRQAFTGTRKVVVSMT